MAFGSGFLGSANERKLAESAGLSVKDIRDFKKQVEKLAKVVEKQAAAAASKSNVKQSEELRKIAQLFKEGKVGGRAVTNIEEFRKGIQAMINETYSEQKEVEKERKKLLKANASTLDEINAKKLALLTSTGNIKRGKVKEFKELEKQEEAFRKANKELVDEINEYKAQREKLNATLLDMEEKARRASMTFWQRRQEDLGKGILSLGGFIKAHGKKMLSDVWAFNKKFYGESWKATKKHWAEMFDSMKQGRVGRAAGRVGAFVKGKAAWANSALSAAATTVSEVGGNAISLAKRKTKDFIAALTASPFGQKALKYYESAKNVFGNVVGFGKKLWDIGAKSKFGQFMGSMFSKIGKSFRGLFGVIKKAGVRGSVGGLGGIALAGLLGAGIGVFLNKFVLSDDTKKMIGKITYNVVEGVKTVWNMLGKFGSFLGKSAAWLLHTLPNAISNFFMGIWDFFTVQVPLGFYKLVTWFSEFDVGKFATETFIDPVKDLVGRIVDAVMEKFGAIAKMLGISWSGATEKAVEVKDKVVSTATNVYDRARSFVGLGPSVNEANKATLEKQMAASGITDPKERAMFLAQMEHESSGFKRLSENMNYSSVEGIRETFAGNAKLSRMSDAEVQKLVKNPEGLANVVYADRMGNTEAGDGWKYRGRGFVQLTGKENYTRASKALGIDLVKNPDLAEQPDIAAKIATWYWKDRGLGDKAKAGDVAGVTKGIQGGSLGLHEREEAYQRYLAKGTSLPAAGGTTTAMPQVPTAAPPSVPSSVASSQNAAGNRAPSADDIPMVVSDTGLMVVTSVQAYT